MNTEESINKVFSMKKGDNSPIVGRKGISRNHLSIVFSEMEFKRGAEIGVLRGDFSMYLFNSVPGLHLTCVDMWINHGGGSGDLNYSIASAVLNGQDATIHNMASADAAKLVDDNSLDFVYIDAAHDFDNVMMDIILWSKKVKVGGIVSGHDFHPNFNYGVIEAVNAYTRCHNIYKWYVTREEKPSWFWVKK